MPTALVTGATAGIGAAFARRFAATGHDLVLVARTEQRLSALADQLTERCGVSVRPITADLSTVDGCGQVESALDGVDLLVNNAGISLHGDFGEAEVAEEERLLSLNVRAVLRLTHAALGPMRQRRSGAIINVSSVSGFSAAMDGSTYPATKAWVTAFTQSVGRVAARDGIRVMALCPGFTRSQFHDSAGIDTSGLPSVAWLSPDQVVGAGLRDLRRGKLVSVPTVRYKLATAVLRHLPLATMRHKLGADGDRSR